MCSSDLLYEVISEGTSEERVSARRRGETVDINKNKPEPSKVIQLPIRYNESVEPARKVAEPTPDPQPPDPDGKLKY